MRAWNAGAAFIAVFFVTTAFAGEIQPYQARTIEPYHAPTVQPYHAPGLDRSPSAPSFVPPRDWSVAGHTKTATVYHVGGSCLVAVLRPGNYRGAFASAATAYIDRVIGQEGTRGSAVLKVAAIKQAGDGSVVARSFVTRHDNAVYYHTLAAANLGDRGQAFHYRCTDRTDFTRVWPETAHVITGFAAGAHGPGQPAAPGASAGSGIHVFTPEERRQMLENDTKAGRTHQSMSQGGGSGGAAAPASPCAPNCGYDYSTGMAAPTLYSPFHNYSPFGN